MPDAAFFARAAAAAGRLMVDTCTITRDPDFTDDSTLNTSTGVLTGAGTVEVYDGPCMVAPQERQQSATEEGGAPQVRSRYRVTIPLSADEVVVGDVVTITASVREPLLVDQTLVVYGVPLRTNAFQRVLDVDLRVRADAQ